MLKIFYAPHCGKNGSAAVYSLLDYAFRKECGGIMPEIKKTPNGKPYFPDRLEIHFSLSHSKTHVLCAVSTQPVGADIESPRTISGHAIRFYSTPMELSFFDPLDLWVLKESYIKLIGGTLAMVKTIHFSCECGKIITPDTSSLSKLYRIGNCRAAVCTYGDYLPDAIELVSGL